MGLEKLISVFVSVTRRVPDALLYMAGHGPIAEVLKARIQAAALEKNVKILGFVPDEDLPLA